MCEHSSVYKRTQVLILPLTFLHGGGIRAKRHQLRKTHVHVHYVYCMYMYMYMYIADGIEHNTMHIQMTVAHIHVKIAKHPCT